MRRQASLLLALCGLLFVCAAKGQQLGMLPVRHTTWADWHARHPDTSVLAEPRGSARDYSVDPYVGYAQSARIWAPVAYRDDRYPAKSVVIGAIVDGQAHAWPFPDLPADRSELEDEVAGQRLRLEYRHDTRAAALFGPDGQELPAFTAYWFAWVAFHPDTTVYKAGHGPASAESR